MRRILTAAALCCGLALAPAAAVRAGNTSAGPAPYSNLAARWWTWVLETDAAHSPILDPDGRDCTVNQPDGIFFLAGSPSGESVTRACAVPAGTPIFFPVVNSFLGPFLDDNQTLYPTVKSVAEQRSLIACMGAAHTPLAWLDGVPLQVVHERSVPFVVRLPANNIFGIPDGSIPNMMLAPTVDEGDYVLVPAISAGTHTLRFTNDPGRSCSIAIDVTYELSVG